MSEVCEKEKKIALIGVFLMILGVLFSIIGGGVFDVFNYLYETMPIFAIFMLVIVAMTIFVGGYLILFLVVVIASIN